MFSVAVVTPGPLPGGNGDTIERGEVHISYQPGRRSRRRSVEQQSMKLRPFLESWTIDTEHSKKGVCCGTGVVIPQGDVVFHCKFGPSQVSLGLKAAADELSPAMRAAGPTFKVEQLKGFSHLPGPLQNKIREAFQSAAGTLPLQAVDVNLDQLPSGGGVLGTMKRLRSGTMKVASAESLITLRDTDGSRDSAGTLDPKRHREATPQGASPGPTMVETPLLDTERPGNPQPDVGSGSYRLEALRPEPLVLPTMAYSEGQSGAGSVRAHVGSSMTPATASLSPLTPPILMEDDEDLNDYERQRREHIRRNMERMRALNIPQLAQELAKNKPKQAVVSKGVSAKKSKPPLPVAERRQSLRQRGVKADATLAAGVDYETRTGQVVLNNQGTAGELFRPSSSPEKRRLVGPLDFKSVNEDPETDAKFLENLRVVSKAVEEGSDQIRRHQDKRRHTLQKLNLQEKDLAKVTKDGVVCLAFHPTTEAAIVAAGDKSGNLGLWNVDQEGEDFDGVLLLKPHKQYINALKFVGGRGLLPKLYTCSYDGSLRVLDLTTGTFLDYPALPEEPEYSAFDCTADGHVAYLGDNLGNMEVLDVRSGSMRHEGFSIRDRKINTIMIEPLEERLLATSCSDTSVCVWDVRKLGTPGAKGVKPVGTIHHGKSCQGAYWAPHGERRLLTTSFDDTIRIWSVDEFIKKPEEVKVESEVVIRHNNNTGRWISPFRSIWGREGDCVLCGDMKRGIAMFDDKGHNLGMKTSDHMTAIPSRLAVHPELPLLAAATSSGRVHVWR